MKNTDIKIGQDYAYEPWDGYTLRVRVLAVERRDRKVYSGRSFYGHKVNAPMVHVQRVRRTDTGEELGEPEWVLPRTIARTWDNQVPIEEAQRKRQEEKDAGVQRAKDLKPEVTARIKALFGDRAWVPANEYTPGGKVELTFEQFLAATKEKS